MLELPGTAIARIVIEAQRAGQRNRAFTDFAVRANIGKYRE